MKIALFSGCLQVLPTRGYGAEQATYDLAAALVELGHEITLIAPERSTPPPGGSLVPTPIIPVAGWDVQERKIARQIVARLSEHDVVHDLSCSAALHDAVCVKYACRRPHLYTANGISWVAPLLSRHNMVVVSHKARELALRGGNHWDGTANDQPHLRVIEPAYASAEVVRYGCDSAFYRPVPEVDPKLVVYVGRPHEMKGLELIPLVARQLPDMNFLCAWRAESEDHKFYERKFLKLFEGVPNLRFEELPPDGEAHHIRKRDLMAKAAVFLHPATYQEACSRGIIEVQMCGTPVAAFKRGGTPELVLNGFSGVLAGLSREYPSEVAAEHATDGLVAAVRSCVKIGRGNVRLWAKERHTTTRMAKDYLGLYERLAGGGRW